MNRDRRGPFRRWGIHGLALALIVVGLIILVIAVGVGSRRAPDATAIAVDLPSVRPSPRPTATPTVRPSPTPTTVPPSPTPTSTVTPIPESLIPTATATGGETHATPSPVASAAGTSTAVPTASSAVATPAEATAAFPLAPRQRIGFSAPEGDLAPYDVDRLGAGWYLTGRSWEPASPPAGLEFVPLVQVLGSTYSPGSQELRAQAAQRPGALWLVGNEPDVIWQDNATPAEYAQVYHQVYTLLKSVDPTCQVAIGGVSQVTPLRLRYLEAVLAAYQQRYGRPMPVDVWNVHLAILREERGAWGVDIPPGLADDQGLLYEIEDNANVEILEEEVRTFRRWMADHGLRDRPLIVTEYSVLMPPEYGFPPDSVEAFMVAGLDFMLTATDEQTGYPSDGNRLVQRVAWYSLVDRVYYTGNLFDPDSAQITSLGLAYARYTADR